jgi:hypothetical protein
VWCRKSLWHASGAWECYVACYPSSIRGERNLSQTQETGGILQSAMVRAPRLSKLGCVVSSDGPLVVIDCWRALLRLESVNGVEYVGLGIGVAREESATGGAAK